MPRKPARIGSRPKGYKAKLKLEAEKRRAAKSEKTKSELATTSSQAQSSTVGLDQEMPVVAENPCDSIHDSEARVLTDVSNQEKQDNVWFWELPDFGIVHEQSSAVDACSPLLDLSAKEADDYAVILDSVHTYSPNENVDDVVNGLKPLFMKNLYTELKNCEFPKHWEVIRFANDVAIIQTTSTASGCPVIQKSVILDSNRNMKVYIHNHLLKMHETWLKGIPKLQITQSIKNTVAILRKTVNALNAKKVCCGNFGAECIFFYNEKVCEKEEAERKSYIEWLNFSEIAADGTNYSRTVRSVNCHFVLKNYIRCTNCAKLRKSMRLSTFRTRIANPNEANVSDASHTTFSALTSQEKIKRLQNLSTALHKEKIANRNLKQKIACWFAK